MRNFPDFIRALTAATLICLVPHAGIAQPLRALTVGGGPDPEMNQYAIESNVRYVDRLLPKARGKTILFADGRRQSASVSYLDGANGPSREELAFRWLFDEPIPNLRPRFRAPQIAKIDGPARKSSVVAAMKKLAANRDARYLLYFTGHGEPGLNAERSGNYDNNLFDLWGGDTLSVRELATALKALPTQKPVVLVMVQCFSGSFGNLIFQDGDPNKSAIDRDFCGFFASVKERPAAGCTPEINEAEYHDFTSYFFAALSGRDRVGRVVQSADYDGSGRVGMDEAFAYAMIHENSIDIPISTSDVYLRRVVDVPIEKLTANSYSGLLAKAAPWQKAALQGLSLRLKLSGEDRLQTVWREIQAISARGEEEDDDDAAFPEARRVALRAQLVAKYPALRSNRQTRSYARARRAAIADLKARRGADGALIDKLNASFHGIDEARAEEREARLYRFLRLSRTIALEQLLSANGQANQQAYFKRLRNAESRNPLTW